MELEPKKRSKTATAKKAKIAKNASVKKNSKSANAKHAKNAIVRQLLSARCTPARVSLRASDGVLEGRICSNSRRNRRRNSRRNSRRSRCSRRSRRSRRSRHSSSRARGRGGGGTAEALPGTIKPQTAPKTGHKMFFKCAKENIGCEGQEGAGTMRVLA